MVDLVLAGGAPVTVRNGMPDFVLTRGIRAAARWLGFRLWRWGCAGAWYAQVTGKCPCGRIQKDTLDLMLVMESAARGE